MQQDEISALQKAVKVIAAQRRRLDEAEARQRAPIAVLGIGCRYPGAVNTPDDLWRLFENAGCPVSARPPARPSWRDDAAAPGFFLDDIDRFDAAHFGISPREARLMDPQQRLLLEVTVEALADAALGAPRLAGTRTGVFIGAMAVDYAALAQRGDLMDVHTGTGTSASILAGRISHHFDWRGPAITVNTSCSSSLVAVHQAIGALRRGECDTAIAGGVNLILTPEVWQIERAAGMLAPDGLCKAFDAAADGFGRGEGCGLVVLKRLADASPESIPYAVLLGSAVNHDGRAAGLMVPNPKAQADVIRAALGDAGVAPADVAYVETHGTGTRLGDPIEAEALAEAYSQGRSQPLLLGAAKANLGHTEGAAGITSLLRLVLALHSGHLPPLPLKTGPSPMIDWTALGLAPARGGEALSSAGCAIGAVSSFGFSGTNAHVVVAPGSTDGARSPTPRTIWAETRYWVPEAPPAAAPVESPARRGHLYVVETGPVNVAPGQAPQGPLVLLARHPGIAPGLTDELRRRGADVVQTADMLPSLAPGTTAIVCPGPDAEAELGFVQVLVDRAAHGRIAAIAPEGDPAGEAVLAYLRSAFADRPSLAAPLVSVGPHVPVGPLADALAARRERQVIVRAEGVFAPRLVPAPLPARGRFAASPSRPYLVTGGYGSLGLELAGWLVARGARHIILLGRNAPSAAVPVGGVEGDARLWSRVLGWRAEGVTVHLESADVADMHAMARIIAENYPDLAGVIHAAGISNTGAGAASLADVLRSKVAGTRVLAELCAGRALDLLLFCSSAAVWGGANLSSYAAANAFMDATARRCPGAVSVQFGGWQGSRMLADRRLSAFQERRGFAALPPARMLELLDEALMLGSPVVAAVDLDSAAYRRSLKPSGLDKFMDKLCPGDAEDVSDSRAMVLAAHPRRRGAILLRLAQEHAARLLGHATPEALQADEPLQNLGFNSLVALEFRDALAAALQLELPGTLVYANPTLRAVADHLAVLLGETAVREGEDRVAAAHDRLSRLLAGTGG